MLFIKIHHLLKLHVVVEYLFTIIISYNGYLLPFILIRTVVAFYYKL